MTSTDVRLIEVKQQLLDRQVVDENGRMVAKVDDLELATRSDGTLEVTAILTGPGALGPRLGGAVGAIATAVWARLSGRDPDDPRRIGIDLVTEVTTVVTLGVSRRDLDVDGFEDWARERVIEAIPGAGEADEVHGRPRRQVEQQPPPEDPHRLARLPGMATRYADGSDGEDVIDVVLRHDPHGPHGPHRFTVAGLVIGRRRPGTLFGYHRHPEQGPRMLRALIRAWHRHTSTVDWEDVDRIDWEAGVVQLRSLRAQQPSPRRP